MIPKMLCSMRVSFIGRRHQWSEAEKVYSAGGGGARGNTRDVDSIEVKDCGIVHRFSSISSFRLYALEGAMEEVLGVSVDCRFVFRSRYPVVAWRS